ncbi:STAS domain-containing protein [Streptomyces sp. HNM0645]|uniref:STAS domain-containing protein n=1 Tax=Streptomyces sp. HNM0645 TaxID=2782343 RepID=UPI0024B78FC3|nr:STAS domain-containing protein [Streptomyces sp. HNM0645]MDI9885824.1 STAS domain-containing protein [Streptomyces sp. HNM0645]
MASITLTTTATNDGTTAVALSGELDIATAGQVELDLAHLVVGMVRELRLDLSGVTFCDSSGADLFVRVHRHCAATGVRLHLCAVPHPCATVFRVLGVDDTVPCSFA